MKYLLICALIFGVSHGSETLKLSLQEAISMAVKSSDDISIKKNEAVKSKFKSLEAKGALLPQVDFVSKWTNNLDVPSPADTNEPSAAINPAAGTIKIANDYQLNHSLQATQVLWTFGQLYNSIKAAQKAYQVSLLDEQITKSEVIYNTKVAYYSALLAKKSLEVAKRSYENAKSNQNLLYKRFSSGRPPKSDNIKMAADVASRLPSLKNAETQYELALLSLKMLIDVDYERMIELTDEYDQRFPQIELDNLTRSMNENEPTLRMLNQVIDLNSDLVRAKRASFFPTLVGFSALSYMGSSKSDFFVGRENMGKMFSVGVQLQFPIWSGGQHLSQYKQAVMEKTNAQMRLRKAQRGFELELKNAHTHYYALLETYKANQQAHKLARQSFEMSRNRFQTGQTSITELNDAELMLTNSLLQTQMTLFNISKVGAQIEKLTAKEGVL